MSSKHNLAAAVALILLSLFPLLAFQYDEAEPTPDMGQVFSVIANWPAPSREVAVALIDSYGAPDDVTAEALTWHRNDPTQHTLICRIDSTSPGSALDEHTIVHASLHDLRRK